jgi:hypothetical protein
MCSGYNTLSAFTTSGTTGWIPGLAPEFISVLPRDPKEVSTYGCYIYRSDGNNYGLLAYHTMETVCDGTDADTTADPGDDCNPTSMQEMDRPGYEEASITVNTVSW